MKLTEICKRWALDWRIAHINRQMRETRYELESVRASISEKFSDVKCKGFMLTPHEVQIRYNHLNYLREIERTLEWELQGLIKRHAELADRKAGRVAA